MYYSPTLLTLAFKTQAMTDPRSDPVWDCTADTPGCGVSGIEHSIDVTGDGIPEFEVFGERDIFTGALTGEVTTESLAHLSTRTFDWSSAGGYTLSFYPGCLGGLAPVSINFYILIDTDPFGSSGSSASDFAPSALGWTPFVTMTTPHRPAAASAANSDVSGEARRLRARRVRRTPRIPDAVEPGHDFSLATGGPYWPGSDIAGGRHFPRPGASGLRARRVRRFAPVPHGRKLRARPRSPHAVLARVGHHHGVALLRDGTGGFVLDGFGGLHGFSIGAHVPPVAVGAPYWAGWDVRGVTMLPDGTGYVVDAFGGIHHFTTTAAVAPDAARPVLARMEDRPGHHVASARVFGNRRVRPRRLRRNPRLRHRVSRWRGGPRPPTNGPYLAGWNIARGMAVLSE